MTTKKNNIDNLKTGNLKVLNTAKILKLNANESVVDSNSVQLPCISEYHGKRATALEYTWVTKINNKPIKRGIKVLGHGEYGIPTLRELDILIALQSIFIKKHTKNGITELKTHDLNSEDLCINFTINELAKELGYKSPNNNVRENIKKGIEILVATSISNLYEGGIYDVKTKKYITDSKKIYHYLESYEGYSESSDGGEKIVDVTKIKISEFFYNMILSNYRLYYNRDVYKKTKNLIARKIYLMALQWMGKNNYAFATIDTLTDRIPMVQSKRKYQKQYIKKALTNLESKGLLNIRYDSKNSNKIYFVKPGTSFDEKELDILNKYNSYDEVVEELKEYGLLAIEIPKYFDVQDIEYVKALLRYGEVLQSYGKINNKREWIIEYLLNKHPVNNIYYNNIS